MHTKPRSPNYTIVETEGIITFKNDYTTLGFVRYSDGGVIDYIFVQPMYRNLGLGKKLLGMVESKTSKQLTLAPPISILGNALFKSYMRS